MVALARNLNRDLVSEDIELMAESPEDSPFSLLMWAFLFLKDLFLIYCCALKTLPFSKDSFLKRWVLSIATVD